MPARIDITGQRYGRLTVISYSGNQRWLCRCDCGNYKDIIGSQLRGEITKSCGCIHSEQIARRNHENRKHGCSDDRLYGIWHGIKQRCCDPNRKDYKNYGGRGIKICDEWKDDFGAFKEWALSSGYNYNAPYMRCTIDRIDNNGNYEPGNCHWVPIKDQMKTRRNNSVRDSRGRYIKTAQDSSVCS